MNRDETLDLIAEATRLVGRLSDALGEKVILAGGAVRDIVHGIRPKDFDFCVLADATCDRYEHMAATAKRALGRLGPDVVVGQCFESYRDGTDLRIAYVIKFLYRGIQCDLIQYVEEDATADPRGQVSSFDTNLNMMWMDATGNIVIEPEALEVITGRTPIQRLDRAHICEGDRARLTYLHSKYPQYAVDHDTVITPEVL